MPSTDSTSYKNMPTLYNKRILFEVTTVGMSQWPLLQEVLNGVRDMCEAGAKVALHITTSDCDSGEDNRCKEEEQQEEQTAKNYPPLILSQINEQLSCSNGLNATIHYYSPTWGKYITNFHRILFYRHLQEFDLFVHTEEDTLIRPTNVATYLRETQKLKDALTKQKFGTSSSFADYSIGFVRYENTDRDRVIWEFQWPDHNDIHRALPEAPLPGYTTTPGDMHHQGMYMATAEQLQLWKDRCDFDIPRNHSSYHREHTSGGLDLYHSECNVTQLLPLASMDDLLIHHLPDKNHRRRPSSQWKSTLELHRQRNKLLRPQSLGLYHGARLVVEHVDPQDHPLEYDLAEYQSFVANGGYID